MSRGMETRSQCGQDIPRPSGCVCAPDSWPDGAGEVCRNYDPYTDLVNVGLCRGCWHDDGCHAKKAQS